MIWDIDGQAVSVLVKEEGDVQIVCWDDQKKVVEVPALLPKAEALWVIRERLHGPDALKEIPSVGQEEIEIFGRVWSVRRTHTNKRPSINGGAIDCYFAKGRLSAKQKEQLKNILLQQLVMQLVGQWEERFTILVSAVSFRKNKKSPFKIDKAKTSVQFDTALYRFSREQIDYCVFKALITFAVLDKNKVTLFADRYFPLRKTIDKVLAYEYQSYDIC